MLGESGRVAVLVLRSPLTTLATNAHYCTHYLFPFETDHNLCTIN
jgi:hypothetical protein